MKRSNIWKGEDDQPSKKKLKNIIETSSESESSDDDADICSICLGKLYKSQVGSPEGCDHVFCLKCILEWSKNVNTCPVDRQAFQIIFARESIHDNSAVIINVQTKDNRDKPDESDTTVCEICSLGDREDRLLLCDGCNKGYHLDCLDPPLHQVPHGDWFCEDCEVISPGPNHQHRSNRMIARTLIYQRVMRNIRRIESSDDDSDDDDDELQDSEEGESEDEINATDLDHGEPLNVVKRKRQTSTRSRRKKKSSGKSKKRKSSRRRKRKSRKKSKRLSSIFGESSHSKQSQKFPFEQNSLSIYGNRLTLHNFGDEAPIPSTSSTRHSKTSTAVSAPKPEGEKNSFDILGDILNGQALLHSKSSDVAIARDGTLKPLKKLPDMRLAASSDAKSKSTFFLTDVSSRSLSSVSSPSVSSSSSPIPLFPGVTFHGSRSRFSDFSESSDDSRPSQLSGSYEDSYKSLTNDVKNRPKDKSETVVQKNLKDKNLLDSFEEYSPICEDEDSQISSKDSNVMTTEKVSTKKEPSPQPVIKNGGMEEETRKVVKHSSVEIDFSNKFKGCSQSGSSKKVASSQGKTKDPEPDWKVKLEDAKVPTRLGISVSDVISISSSSWSVGGVESTNGDFPDVKKDEEEEEEEDRKIVREDENSRMDDEDDDDDCDDDGGGDDDDVDVEEASSLNKSDNLQPATISSSKKEEWAKRLSAIEKLMQDALKSFYLSKQINKDDYKQIMRNGVSKIMKSRDRRVEPAKVQKFVNQYVVSVLKKKLS